MADNSTYSRIYELRTQGADKVIADINSIIARMEYLGQVKARIMQSTGAPLDEDVLKGVNEQLTDMTAQLTAMANASQMGTAAQNDMATAMDKVTEVQKGISVSMTDATKAMGDNLSAAVAGVASLQSSFAAGNVQGEAYTTIVNNLTEKLAMLKDQAADMAKEVEALTTQQEEGAAKSGENAAKAAQQTAELQKLRSQILDVNSAMESMTRIRVAEVLEEETKAAESGGSALHKHAEAAKDAAAKQSELKQKLADTGTELASAAASGKTTTDQLKKLTEGATEMAKALIDSGDPMDSVAKLTKSLGDVLVMVAPELQLFVTIGESLIDVFGAMEKKVPKATKEIIEFGKALLDAKKENNVSIAKEKDEVNFLIAETTNKDLADNTRLDAANELKSKYGEILKKLDPQDIMNGAASTPKNKLAFFTNNESTIQSNILDYLDVKEKVKDYDSQLDLLYKEAAKIEENFKLLGYDKNVKSTDSDFDGKKRPAPERDKKKLDKIHSEIYKLIEEKMKAIITEDHLINPYGNEKEDEKGEPPVKVTVPHIAIDYTADKEDADKKMEEYAAKNHEEAIKMTQDIEKEGFSDEKNSLNARLTLYKAYMDDERDLLKQGSEAKIKEVQDTLNKIAEIERQMHDGEKSVTYFDANGQLKPEANKLLLNKRALEEKGKALQAEYERRGLDINFQQVKGEKDITNSDAEGQARERREQLNDMDALKARKDAAIKDNAAKQRRVVDNDKDLSPEERKKKMQGIDYSEQLSLDQNNIDADADKKKTIEGQLNTVKGQPDSEGKTKEQKKLQDELTEVEKKGNEDRARLEADKRKQQELEDEQDKALQKQVVQSSVQVASQIANSYMDLMAKETAYREAMAQRALDWNRKQTDSQVQSNQQKSASDKAYQLAQQQLDKQKMADQKKQAEESATIDYVTASMKVFADGGFTPETLIQEAGLTAAYVAKIAMLSAAPAYADGTESHPGGWSWVGDGGEPELIRVGSRYTVSPSTATAVNLPKGAEVVPFSHISNTTYSGTMGAQLKAPTVYKGAATGSGGGSTDYSALHESVAMLHQSVGTIANGLQNMQVSLDTNKAGRAIKNNYYKKVYL